LLGELLSVGDLENKRIGLVEGFDGLVHVVVFPVLLSGFGELQCRIEEPLVVIGGICFASGFFFMHRCYSLRTGIIDSGFG